MSDNRCIAVRNNDIENLSAFILCGGKGTRLRPYTYTMPKPMLRIGNRPLLEYVIRNLKRSGIEKHILTVGYLKEHIKNYFGDGSKFGVEITYLEEDEPKNTAGSILDGKKLIENGSPFIVIMGDHLTDINMRDMIKFHKNSGAAVTMAIKIQALPLEYGIVEIRDKRIVEFKEKPVLNHYINTAIYVCEYKTFDYIKEGSDFANDVFPLMLSKGEKLAPYLFDGYWEDIGRIHDYQRVHQIISLLDFIKEF